MDVRALKVEDSSIDVAIDKVWPFLRPLGTAGLILGDNGCSSVFVWKCVVSIGGYHSIL